MGFIKQLITGGPHIVGFGTKSNTWKIPTLRKTMVGEVIERLEHLSASNIVTVTMIHQRFVQNTWVFG
jgi:hypothetical protein